MSLVGQLHTYLDGGLIDSSDWDDELNQLLSALGALINAGPYNVVITGQTNDSATPIIKVNKNTAGTIVLFSNESGLVSLYFSVNGVITTDALFSVLSTIKCPNLNADLLGGQHAAALQTALYAFNVYPVFYAGSEAASNPDKPTYCVSNDLTITKLKLKQEGVASADASTVVTFYKNGVSIGTVSVAGNVAAVQTNDIVDVTCVSGDKLTTSVTTYAGTTKHTNITAEFHFKQKFVNQ